MITFDSPQLSVIVRTNRVRGWSPGKYDLFAGVVVTTAATVTPREVTEIRWMPRRDGPGEATEPYDKGRIDLLGRMREGALILAMVAGHHPTALFAMAVGSAKHTMRRTRTRLDREERRRFEQLVTSDLGETEDDEAEEYGSLIAGGGALAAGD